LGLLLGYILEHFEQELAQLLILQEHDAALAVEHVPHEREAPSEEVLEQRVLAHVLGGEHHDEVLEELRVAHLVEQLAVDGEALALSRFLEEGKRLAVELVVAGADVQGLREGHSGVALHELRLLVEHLEELLQLRRQLVQQPGQLVHRPRRLQVRHDAPHLRVHLLQMLAEARLFKNK